MTSRSREDLERAIEEHIKAVAAEAPPPTDDVRHRIRELLQGGGGDGTR